MSEFNLINNFFKTKNVNQTVRISIGDDAAILQNESTSLFSNSCALALLTDSKSNNNKAIDQSVVQAISSLMDEAKQIKAKPKWLILNLILNEISHEFLTCFSKILHRQLERHNLELVGGDTSKGKTQIILTLISERQESANLT